MFTVLTQSKWRLFLGLLGVVILLVTVFYADYLADKLAEKEAKNQEIYLIAQKTIAENEDLERDIEFENAIIRDYSVPVISKDQDDFYYGNNWGERRDTSQAFLAKKYTEAIESGKKPINVVGPGGYEILIFPSPLFRLIRLFPVVQLLLLSVFSLFGYLLVNTARRSEQNRVWAGMAKETAHQLGTPISAMIGWISILRDGNQNQPDNLEAIDELEKDVDRLELIADRFSKIGSDPELESVNIYDELDSIEDYMKRRASRKVEFEFPKNKEPIQIKVNEHLFSWVLENLIRNALDAMDGVGKISALVEKDSDQVRLYVSDTGKGIPTSQHKDIFTPGFTTKKRGWGLGLSLAKRIIEQYHKGKIFVKQSKVNEGTTFAIYLPI